MDDLQLASEISLSEGIFRNDMMADLERSRNGKPLRCRQRRECKAYTTPKLMATSAPSFSLLLMATPQIIFHGRMVRIMSSAPEYAIVHLWSAASLG